MSKLGVPSADGKHVGDLYVEIHVKQDPYFKRINQDLHVDVPVSVTQAILGGTVDVLTVDGMIEMTIPAGSQPGSKLLLRSKGLPVVNARNRRGNQYVHVGVQIPKTLTDRQKELMAEFQREEIIKNGGDPDTTGDGDSGVKRPFSIEEAWKRVKKFMRSCDEENTNSKKDSDSEGKSDNKANATEK